MNITIIMFLLCCMPLLAAQETFWGKIVAVSDLKNELGIDIKTNNGKLLGLTIGSISDSTFGKGNGALQSLVKAIWFIGADSTIHVRVEANMRDDYPEYGTVKSLRAESKHSERAGSAETMRGGKVARVTTGVHSYWWASQGGPNVTFLPQGADEPVIHQFVFNDVQSETSKGYSNLLASLSFDQSSEASIVYILSAPVVTKYPGDKTLHTSEVVNVIKK